MLRGLRRENVSPIVQRRHDRVPEEGIELICIRHFPRQPRSIRPLISVGEAASISPRGTKKIGEAGRKAGEVAAPAETAVTSIEVKKETPLVSRVLGAVH